MLRHTQEPVNLPSTRATGHATPLVSTLAPRLAIARVARLNSLDLARCAAAASHW